VKKNFDYVLIIKFIESINSMADKFMDKSSIHLICIIKFIEFIMDMDSIHFIKKERNVVS